MNNIQLIQVTPEELVTMISDSVKTQIQEIKFLFEGNNKKQEKEFLTRSETAKLFNVSLVTIHDWQKNGILKVYKMGNRSFFKYSELIDTLYNSNRS